MELTAKQRKDLRAALEKAFPSQPELELMVEDELEENLNHITQGQPNYELAVRDLVKWAEAKGKLRDLVIGASVKNSGNPQLQEFIKEHLQTLLDIGSHLSSNLLSSDLLEPLIQYLTVIADFEDIVLPACRQTLPEFELHNSDQIGYLLNSKLSPSVKWLILLVLLLEYGSNSEDQLFIIIFIQNLQRWTVGTFKFDLNTWLTKLPAKLQPNQALAARALGQARPSDESLRKLQVCFLILVEPPEITSQTDRFGVNGYLVTRIGNDDQYTKFQDINLQTAIPIPSSSQGIELGQQKKGFSCNFPQIEINLPDWLLEAERAIDERCIELQDSYDLKLRPAYDLTVEFWLPFENLTATTDKWKIYGKPISRRNRNLVVGKKHRVVVRSYDRFSDTDALNELIRTWENFDK